MKSIEIKFVASSHCVLRHEKFGTQDLTSWPPPMWQTLDSISENWSFGCSKGVAQSIWQRGGETSLENLCDFYVKTRQVGSNVGVIFVSLQCVYHNYQFQMELW